MISWTYVFHTSALKQKVFQPHTTGLFSSACFLNNQFYNCGILCNLATMRTSQITKRCFLFAQQFLLLFPFASYCRWQGEIRPHLQHFVWKSPPLNIQVHHLKFCFPHSRIQPSKVLCHFITRHTFSPVSNDVFLNSLRHYQKYLKHSCLLAFCSWQYMRFLTTMEDFSTVLFTFFWALTKIILNSIFLLTIFSVPSGFFYHARQKSYNLSHYPIQNQLLHFSLFITAVPYFWHQNL